MSGFAWVTLATNDSYSLGALVLAHSLKKVNTAHKLVVLITPTVSQPMRNQLETVFDLVKLVEVLDSKDEAHLALLNRPELGITFTKLHCWRLTQFEKCVFVDADTLVVKNCDDLFEREELSAAPDFGWPDCFNSGVFVFKPSVETFDKILKFAVEKGSYDGGDQGLLNQYFTDWTKDINKHLPFVYNLSSVAAYSYYPAFKQFGSETRIFHYIGTNKPWLQNLNPATRTIDPVPGASYLTPLFQKWWDIFCEKVLPSLDKNLENFNGMSLPPEAWTNHVAVEINLETQKLSPQTEPCPPHQATDDFRQFNLPYRSFDVKSPSGTLLNVGFSMDQAFAPLPESKEVREIEEKSEPDQKEDEKKEENEKKEEDKEEKKEEVQKEPEVPKGPFDHETFFPDEKCVSDYMQQNVMLYQLFGDSHCQQVSSSENKFENYVPEQQHIEKNCEERSEETVPSLPRFLTIPENDERQSGNVKVTEKLKVNRPVAEEEKKTVSEQHSEKQIVEPIAPIAPVIPEVPVTHVAPVNPVAPVAPVTSVTPVICAPVAPVEPVMPTEPNVPIEPVAPIAPSSKTESPVAEIEKSKPKSTIKKFLFDVTKFGSAVKTSVRTFQTNSNDNPAKKFSMPKLKPLLPKKNLNQKPAPAPFSQITAYTEFIMSSDYKEPADLPNDKVGFVQTQISKKAEVTKKKEEKFGPLPYAEKENKFESPQKEEPELEKIQPELYDLRFCKRQMGNKPKPKDTKERSEGKFLVKPWKGKKSLRNKKRAKDSQVKEKTRKPEEPKLKTSKKSKSETKTPGRTKDNKKETNNNTNDLEHILNRLRNFSKNYLHFFKETNEKMKSVPNFGYENGLASPIYNKPLVIEEIPDRRNIGV